MHPGFVEMADSLTAGINKRGRGRNLRKAMKPILTETTTIRQADLIVVIRTDYGYAQLYSIDY